MCRQFLRDLVAACSTRDDDTIVEVRWQPGKPGREVRIPGVYPWPERVKALVRRLRDFCVSLPSAPGRRGTE